MIGTLTDVQLVKGESAVDELLFILNVQIQSNGDGSYFRCSKHVVWREGCTKEPICQVEWQIGPFFVFKCKFKS